MDRHLFAAQLPEPPSLRGERRRRDEEAIASGASAGVAGGGDEPLAFKPVSYRPLKVHGHRPPHARRGFQPFHGREHGLALARGVYMRLGGTPPGPPTETPGQGPSPEPPGPPEP